MSANARSIAQGVRRTVHLDATAGTYAYVRSMQPAATPAADDVLSAFNLSEEERTIALDLAAAPVGCHCLLATGPVAHALTARRLSITLAPRTGAAFAIDPGA